MAEFDDYGDPVVPDEGGGNFLTKKFGPLPMYVWVIIALVAAYFIYKKGLFSNLFGSSSTTSAGSSESTTPEITTVDSTVPTSTDSGSTTTDTSANASLISKLKKRNQTLRAELSTEKHSNAADEKTIHQQKKTIAKDKKIISKLKKTPIVKKKVKK